MSFNTPGAVPEKKRVIWPYIVGAIAIVLLYFVGAFVWSIKAWQPKVTATVEEFHSRLNAGQFEQIYTDSDDRLKKAISEEDFVTFLTSVHQKIGDANQASQTNILMNKTASGTFLVVNFTTAFAGDNKTEEQFTLLTSGDGLKLVGYRINSNKLITK